LVKRILFLAATVLLFANTSQAAFRNAAWIAPWRADALTALQQRGGALAEANPVWYEWNADGTIAKVWNAENPTWRAAMSGLSIVPTIQELNGNMLALNADPIVQLAVTNAYDGIDIDYERFPATSRAAFTTFIQTLATKLHAANKKLSVTVYAKASDKENWSGPGSQDFVAIGGAADSVKVMAYDYHWSTSGAGAITPMNWLDQVTAYAESTIPSRKIVMGLPWYGYDWPSTGAASTVSYASAMQIATANNATIAHDPASGEATFTYNGRTVFFQDAAADNAKIAMLQQKHGAIAGVTHWAMGYEDPSVWTASTSPVTPAPADFTFGGPTSVSVQQGNTATANYTLTPINNFTGATSVTVTSPINASISPVMTTTQAATLIVTTSRTTAPGAYPITIRATSGTNTHEFAVVVNVTAAPVVKGRAARH